MPTSSFLDFVLDQLAPLGEVTAQRMFGGHGLYRGEVFFAIVWKSRLFFKVDDDSRKDYEARGMKPFRPSSKQTLSSYFEVPVEVLEDAREIAVWARRAVRAQEKKKDKGKRTKDK